MKQTFIRAMLFVIFLLCFYFIGKHDKNTSVLWALTLMIIFEPLVLSIVNRTK